MLRKLADGLFWGCLLIAGLIAIVTVVTLIQIFDSGRRVGVEAQSMILLIMLAGLIAAAGWGIRHIIKGNRI